MYIRTFLFANGLSFLRLLTLIWATPPLVFQSRDAYLYDPLLRENERQAVAELLRHLHLENA